METLQPPNEKLTLQDISEEILKPKLPNGEPTPDGLRLRDFVAKKMKEAGLTPGDRDLHATPQEIVSWWNFLVVQGLGPEDEVGIEAFQFQ